MAIKGRSRINSINPRSVRIRSLGSSYIYYEIYRMGQNRTAIYIVDEKKILAICSS
jgi:hypothetical protein